MTNNYLSYGKPREEIKHIADANPLYSDMICFSDIDGVLNATKNLTFYDLALTALVVLQPLFATYHWLTGRYAQLFMNEGIPRLRALGWNFNNHCAVIAEMGAVTIRPVDRISKAERDLIGLIIDDPEHLFVGRDKQWAAIANAPKVEQPVRETIYKAFKRVLERHVSIGNLSCVGIDRGADIDTLAPKIYDPESCNFFKGTLTTSIVPPEWKDLAFKVHEIIGSDVAIEINEDLQGYNSTAPRKLVAINHLDCVEVLFEGIAKLPTTLQAIQAYEATFGAVKTVITQGDAYKDIEMARAANLANKLSIHFHFGNAAKFEQELRTDTAARLEAPDFIVLFPEYDDAWIFNPGLTSVNTAATALWSFIKAIRENPQETNWLCLLRKINNAKVITKSEISSLC